MPLRVCALDSPRARLSRGTRRPLHKKTSKWGPVMAALTFGPFSLDTRASRLMREGTDVRLRPRAFHTLRVLAQRPGEFIDYAGMIAEAWEGTHVSPHTVDVTVGEVRKHLG